MFLTAFPKSNLSAKISELPRDYPSWGVVVGAAQGTCTASFFWSSELKSKNLSLHKIRTEQGPPHPCSSTQDVPKVPETRSTGSPEDCELRSVEHHYGVGTVDSQQPTHDSDGQ